MKSLLIKSCTWLATPLAVLTLVMLLTGQCVLICQQEEPRREYHFKEGERVNPLADFDFSTGEWSAFVQLSWEDQGNLPKGIPKAAVLCTHDVAVLSRLRDHVGFHFKGGDLATVTSQLLILRDGRLVFETGIVIESASEGFQSRDFGWMPVQKPGELAAVLRAFKVVRSPIIWL